MPYPNTNGGLVGAMRLLNEEDKKEWKQFLPITRL
jgi:hypothetical protein